MDSKHQKVPRTAIQQTTEDRCNWSNKRGQLHREWVDDIAATMYQGSSRL